MSNRSTDISFESKVIPKIEILTLDAKSIISDFSQRKAEFPKMYDKVPVIIDITRLPSNILELDAVIEEALREIINGFRSLELIPISISGCSENVANKLGLNTSKPTEKTNVIEDPEQKSNLLSTGADENNDLPKDNLRKPSTKIVNGSIRSGTTVYDPEYDNLIITGDVKYGSEVAARGNILILGKLEGRAHAGHEQPDSVLFAMKFYPEVAGINGLYVVNEHINTENMNKPTLLKIEHDSVISMKSY